MFLSCALCPLSRILSCVPCLVPSSGAGLGLGLGSGVSLGLGFDPCLAVDLGVDCGLGFGLGVALGSPGLVLSRSCLGPGPDLGLDLCFDLDPGSAKMFISDVGVAFVQDAVLSLARPGGAVCQQGPDGPAIVETRAASMAAPAGRSLLMVVIVVVVVACIRIFHPSMSA